MTRSIRLAPAAAAACASSRCSSAAKHPDTSRPRARSRSGSTRHDEAECSPESRARGNRLIARSRVSASLAHQTSPSSLPRRTANRKCPFTRHSSPYSNDQHYRPATAPGCTRSVRYGQIPIARHRSSSPIPRGFLPWRLSDDGPGASRRAHNGAVVRNPSHDPTLAAQTARALLPVHGKVV
jgi:hypothetical protein